jgi:proliferating cell nuclear antigen
MAKILKCAGNDDSVKMQCQDEGEERQSEFEIKLMDLDTEHLGIPVFI